jgi:glycoside/pentoside/hexuronide:cation symporter, GPH family
MTRMSRAQLITYSAGGLAMNLTNLVVSQWLYERYVAGGVLSAAAFSVILLAGRLTDGFSDPLMAFWTDNTRSRWGRRIPFLVMATLPFALVCYLLWTPPTGAPEWVRVTYAVIVSQLYFLLYTVVVTPYLSLLPEIARSNVERLNLTTGQAIAALIGTLLFALCGAIVATLGYNGIGILLAIAALLSFYPLTWFIRENAQLPANRDASLRELFRWVVQIACDRNFLPLLVATSFYWFGLNLLLMLVPRWVEEVLHQGSGTVTWLMLPFIAVNLVGFFLFNFVARRIGKYRAFLLSLGLSALVFPGIGFAELLPFGSPLFNAQVIVALAGLPVAGFAVLPFALLADVADADALKRGNRREAIFFGVQAIFQKSMIGVSIVTFAWVHQAFEEWSLRWIALLAGLGCLIGLAGFLPYPLRQAEGAGSRVQGEEGVRRET